MDAQLRKRNQSPEEWARVIRQSGQLPDGIWLIPGDRVMLGDDRCGQVIRIYTDVIGYNESINARPQGFKDMYKTRSYIATVLLDADALGINITIEESAFSLRLL